MSARRFINIKSRYSPINTCANSYQINSIFAATYSVIAWLLLTIASPAQAALTPKFAIYAMLSKNTHYVDKTVAYEALMVARNSPRWLQILVKHGFVPAPA
jgi:hypothetical protein